MRIFPISNLHKLRVTNLICVTVIIGLCIFVNFKQWSSEAAFYSGTLHIIVKLFNYRTL
jgi:membrane-bound metal-dependent hydrolase YbcI (DUF457 family)